MRFSAFISDPVNAAYISVIGLVLGVIGVAIGIYTFVKQRQRRELVYRSDTTSIADVAGFPDANIKVQIAGDETVTLSATHLALWNEGNTEIPGEAISEAEPLRLEVPEQVRVFAVAALIANNPDNKVVVERNSDQILIKFAFLGPRDGVVVRVFHSGGSRDIKLAGRVRGASVRASEGMFVNTGIGSLLLVISFLAMAGGVVVNFGDAAKAAFLRKEWIELGLQVLYAWVAWSRSFLHSPLLLRSLLVSPHQL